MEKIFEKTAKKAEELTKLLDQLINCYPNIDGKTALHLASERGNLMMVKFLINRGAQIEAKNNGGQNPLHYAYNPEVAKYLIDNGTEIESKDNYGFTSLLWAAKIGNNDVVKCLIENGADVEAKSNLGKTSIHTAAVSGHLEILTYLKEKGAQLESIDNIGNTPLHECFININVSKTIQDTMKYLIQNSTNLDIKGKDGATVLHLAVVSERLDLVKCLIEHGASFDIRDSKGYTAFDMAKLQQNKEIAKILIQRKRDTENKNPPKTISDKALCIICFEPRNGLHVLLPCGHTSLCELCCFNLKNERYSKCPSCRKPVKDYQKIFFQEPETEITKNSNQ